MRKLKIFGTMILAMGSAMLLGGCKDLVLIHSKGAIGQDERDLIYTALFLMLLVVIPVIIMTVVFAIRYRASNVNANYDPHFHHSTKIEAVIWGIPLLIIVILGAIVWKTTHSLDPYRPLDSNVKPLEVQVVALNWKWLFIYPEQNIATVNHLELPVNVPINFKITADDVPMNSFMIPQLGGQVYAMAGMQTQLHLIANAPGSYEGRGYAFNGQGFNGMVFKTDVVDANKFVGWVKQIKSVNSILTDQTYNNLAQPSEYVKPLFFASVAPNLFDSIMMKFMMPMTNGEHNDHMISMK